MIKAKAYISSERDPIRLSGIKGDAVKVLIEMNLDSEQFMELKDLIGENFTVIMSKEDFEIINN
jgi:hypothetical protein